jgi:hypothetical protein
LPLAVKDCGCRFSASRDATTPARNGADALGVFRQKIPGLATTGLALRA